MAMSNGAKVGLVAVAGIGAFLLAGGSSSAASAKPIDPCNKTPPDCASLTACVAKLLPLATKTDVPDLQKVSAVAKSLGCADLVKQLDAKIAELSKTGGGTTTTTPVGKFSPSTVKDKQRLIDTAWTLARMGPWSPLGSPPSAETIAEDKKLYNIQSNGSFGSVPNALTYGATGRPIGDRGRPGNPKIARTPMEIFRDMQDAAGIIVDGAYGKLHESESDKAWRWALSAGSPAHIGSEYAHNHRVTVGSESVAGRAARDAADSVGQSVGIHNPESFGPYNTVPAYDEGYVKFDRAFGSQFGAGPANGPLARTRAFGRSARFGIY